MFGIPKDPFPWIISLRTFSALAIIYSISEVSFLVVEGGCTVVVSHGKTMGLTPGLGVIQVPHGGFPGSCGFGLVVVGCTVIVSHGKIKLISEASFRVVVVGWTVVVSQGKTMGLIPG